MWTCRPIYINYQGVHTKLNDNLGVINKNPSGNYLPHWPSNIFGSVCLGLTGSICAPFHKTMGHLCTICGIVNHFWHYTPWCTIPCKFALCSLNHWTYGLFVCCWQPVWVTSGSEKVAGGAPTNGSIFSKLPMIWTVCSLWINYPYINVYYEKEKFWGGKNIARAPLAPGLTIRQENHSSDNTVQRVRFCKSILTPENLKPAKLCTT